MAYIKDTDLDFLGKLDNSDLNNLVKLLTDDWNSDLRIHDLYKNNAPNHKKYWECIAADIQSYGANSLASMLRGGDGVLYKEVLHDVCAKLKVEHDTNSPIDQIELSMLLKIVTDSLEKLTPEELTAIVKELKIKTKDISAQAVTAALQAGIRLGGFASYQLAMIVANAAYRALFTSGIDFAINSTITKTMAVFAGPIGWALTGAWTAIDIAGPAYRVTIPATIEIAYLRLKIKQK